MELVLLNKNLLPLILSHLDPNDQSNARLVCTLWNSIIENNRRKKTYFCVSNSKKNEKWTFIWTSIKRGGKIPIVEKFWISLEHRSHAETEFNIKTRSFDYPLHWVPRMNRMNNILHELRLRNLKTNKIIILHFNNPELVHRAFHVLQRNKQTFQL